MDIELLPGTSLVELESEHSFLSTDLIALPDSHKAKPIKVGRVTKSKMTNLDRAHIGLDDMAGRRIMLDAKHGTWLHGMTYLVRNLVQVNRHEPKKRPQYITPFVAIIHEGIKVSATGNEGKRCRFCGPAISTKSDNNVLLVQSTHGLTEETVWYCPRCRKREDGAMMELATHG